MATSVATPPSSENTTRRSYGTIAIQGGSGGTESQNSFSADSPYYNSYVENELRTMAIMHETLHDIAGRTKTFDKCGNLMSEATRRLALACRLRRPYTPAEDEKEMELQEQQMEKDVAARRRALGADMVSLLGVMAQVSTIGVHFLYFLCIVCTIVPPSPCHLHTPPNRFYVFLSSLYFYELCNSLCGVDVGRDC